MKSFVTHELKTWPEFFNAMLRGDKTFEVRKNDRGFKIGDYLRLREFNPEHEGLLDLEYTGRELMCNVTYILRGPAFGIEDGWCVMGLKVL